MKKILTAFASVLLLVGCNKAYDDTALKERVTALETKVGNLEAQMKAIFSASGDGVFVLKVEKLVEDEKVVGITVTYSNLEVVTFKISGAGQGQDKLSVIKNSDGILCWAINGEIMKVDGKDLTVSTLPELSIEGGHLYMTVNGKKTDVGSIGGSLSDAIFKDIAVADDAVVLTMDDNSTVRIPFAKAFRLVIGKTQYAVSGTTPIEIPYTVDNKTSATVVDIFTDGNFSAEVQADKFVVTPLTADAKGSALAYADSKVGLTSIVKLTFGGTAEPDKFEVSDEKAEEGIDYIAEAVNGSVEIHAVSNIPFEVKPQVDWIHFVSTKATSYTITLSIDDNPASEIRTGTVKIVRQGTDELLQTITIAQKAKVVEKDYYAPAGWDKVLNLSDYRINSTFKWATPLSLNPASVTFQWKFYSNKWNNGRFKDKDGDGNQLFCNRLGQFASADESNSVLLRFSNDTDTDGQLCLNAKALGVTQVQVSKDGKAYAWPTGQWTVVSIVCDGTNLLVYKDDELIQTIAKSNAADSFSFGRFDLSMTWDDGSKWPLKQAFNGYTAYARVWSRALSASDIAATLCEVPAANSEGLEVNWEFKGKEDKYVGNSASGNAQCELDFTSCWDGNDNAKDNGDVAAAGWVALAGSEMANLCYKTGEVVPEDPDEPVAEKVKAVWWGNKDAAAWYKAFNKAISLPEGYSMTIHFYYDAAKQQRLGNFGGADESPCNMLRFGEAGNNNQLEWMVDTGAGRVKIRSSVDAVPAQWNAVTLTAGADGYKMYINGTAAGEDASAYKSGVSFQAIEFANSWGTSYRAPFDGAIAYVSLWSKQLSAGDVAANVFSVPSGTGLEAFWPMLEGEGSIFRDATGKYDDIDLRYCTRCDDEVNYIEVDVSSYIEWREYPAIKK